MKLKLKFPSYSVGGLICALIVLATGWAMLESDNPDAHSRLPGLRLRRVLSRASYDWSFGLTRFSQPDISASDVLIVYIDEESLRDLEQPLNAPMDRALHAALLRRLKEDGAKAVIMDIMFTDPGPDPATDADFAQAIRENGRVVLGMDFNPDDQVKFFSLRRLTPPYPLFEQAAAKTGLVLLRPDGDFLARQHFHALDKSEKVAEAPPSLSWATAQMVGLKVAQDPAQGRTERWINYYGPPGTIPHVSYKYAYSSARPGFFHNKIVFIGARPIISAFIDKRDELRNPYPSGSAGNKEYIFMPMVEVHATQFLNLLRGDWLTRPSRTSRLALLAGAAFVFGFGLLPFRPWVATGLALAGAVAVLLLAQGLFVMRHLWFPWLIIAGIQIPCALLCSFLYRSLEWIIQRRKLEEERRRADLRIREQAALLDKAHDAIIVHDLDWRPQYWNKGAENLYGWTFEELKQKNLRAEIFRTDEAKLLDAFHSTLAKGEWLGELKQATKDGRLLTIQSRWTLVRDEVGQPKSLFLINTDVTEQKGLQAQFLRTQRMESIGTLAGGIAHDLNNVLAPILMGVEIIQMKTTDDHSQKLLANMGASARRGADMVKQVLTFARGHDGERSLLQITHLIREMQKIAKETFPKTIEFRICVDSVWPILGNATQIHQILLNLCVNARDAMPEGGSILIEASNVTLTEAEARKFVGAKPIKYVLLGVSDTGSGIAPEIMDKIFEPFFTTKELGKGTGLGLSTVISIIKSHNGFLDVKSEVGKGTTFNIYLPAADASAAAPPEPASCENLRGQGQMVMIVDDEPAVLDLTKTILVHYGYKVVTALHGADALALYGQYKEKIKVVLMDMMMPVMDGPTAIRALRQQQPDLQFIAISGLMQSDILKQRLGDAEITFLPKPYTTEKLLQNLHRLLTPDKAGGVSAK